MIKNISILVILLTIGGGLGVFFVCWLFDGMSKHDIKELILFVIIMVYLNWVFGWGIKRET